MARPPEQWRIFLVIQRPNPKKNMVYAGVDYNLTLCPLQHIYHGLPYMPEVDLNPMPESTLSPQSGTLDLASVSVYTI